MSLQITLLVALTIGAVWKTVDLVRSAGDRLLRLLVACLWLLALGHALSLTVVTKALDAATTLGVSKVAYNALVMSGLFALVSFFVYATRGDGPAARRRFRIDGVLLAATLLAMLVLMIVTPAALRGHTLSTPNITEAPIAWFYLVGNVYFVYAYLVSGLWALRYSVPASRSLTVALWIITLGLAGLTFTSVNRAIWVLIRYNGGPPLKGLNAINWPISNASFVLVTLGMCLPAVVQLIGAVRSWLLHRRLYRELDPLWSALHRAFPELELERPENGRFRFGRTHRGFYRRLIECRDGLVRLSPYIAIAAKGEDVSRCTPAELAGYIRFALTLKPGEEDPGNALNAVSVAIPEGSDMNSDVRGLVAVSNALVESRA
ncbi:MAB_1171c family putative transporter [Amycolatopsis samaneae]|uniref:MAB_1171c family putative transporter n=1 Tax=Amycolatopsis samaneae TaxID=664691 RepID=A0ABW5GLT5_9PSEU